MISLGFRRKLTALALCKSIESAIQCFQIHHRITFATLRNPVVYLSGARVSIFSTFFPDYLGGKASKNKLKDTSFTFPVTNVTILSIFRTHAQDGYSKVFEMKSTSILYSLALFFLKTSKSFTQSLD